MNYRQQLKNNLIKTWGREPTSLDDLAECCIAVINQWLTDNGEDNRVVGFSWDIRLDKSVSNSHNCPINGDTNWDRDPDKPLGYPGYYGRVWIRYANKIASFGSKPFESTLTYPGTGGGGSYGGPWQAINALRYDRHGYATGPDLYPVPKIYSWDYKFFIHDFEGLEHWINWLILQDKSYATHRYTWQDPKIKQADLDFMHGKWDWTVAACIVECIED